MCEKAPRDFNEISEFIMEFIIYWWSTLYFVCFHLFGLQLKTTGWKGRFFFTIRELENVMSTIQHNHVYGSLRNSNAFDAWRRFETSSEVTLVNWKNHPAWTCFKATRHLKRTATFNFNMFLGFLIWSDREELIAAPSKVGGWTQTLRVYFSFVTLKFDFSRTDCRQHLVGFWKMPYYFESR